MRARMSFEAARVTVGSRTSHREARASIGVGDRVLDATPELETKTALKENATGTRVTDRAVPPTGRRRSIS
jgi:hypothetical protein